MSKVTQLTEAQILEDPEHVVLILSKAAIAVQDEKRRADAYESVLAAFDELRRTGYVPVDYTPQWRARALHAEKALRAPITEMQVEAALKSWYGVPAEWSDKGRADMRAALEAARDAS